MRQQVAALIVSVALAGGAGTGFVVRDARADADEPAVKPSPSATTPKPTEKAEETTPAPQQPAGSAAAPPPKQEPTLVSLSSMQIGTGTVGPIGVGLTVEAAEETGYFDADVEACGGGLQWKTDYAAVLDVGVAGGLITSLGVRAPGPRTISGLGVGSTFASVRDVVGADVLPEAVGGASGVFVGDGAGWIGFRFEVAPEAITDETPVSYIEVGRGAKPDLVRAC